MTPDHQFFVGDLSTTSAATVSSRGYVNVLEKPTKRSTSKLLWKQIGDAEQATLLAPRSIAFELPDRLDIDLHDFAVRPSQLERYRTEIFESYDLGLLFGTFLGDGHAFINTNGRSEIGNVSWYFGADGGRAGARSSPTPSSESSASADDRGHPPNLITVRLYSLAVGTPPGRVRQAHREAPAPEVSTARIPATCRGSTTA